MTRPHPAALTHAAGSRVYNLAFCSVSPRGWKPRLQFVVEGKFYNPDEPVERLPGGNLPHWRQEGVLYFVTFRLADSLPEDRLKELRVEREKWLGAHPEPWSRADRTMYYKLFIDTIHEWLDQGAGSCIFANKEHRRIVEGTLSHFDEIRYELGNYVVASNHVHVLVGPTGGHSLAKILHSWKSFSSNELTKLPAVREAFSEF